MANPSIKLMASNHELVTIRNVYLRWFWKNPTRNRAGCAALSALYHREVMGRNGRMVFQARWNNDGTHFVWYSPQQQQHITVQIESLLFIDYPIAAGDNEWDENKSHLENANEFEPICGTHILHNVWGKIKMLWVYYSTNARASSMQTPIDMNAIYPSARFNVNAVAPNPMHSLLLGLYFPRMPPNTPNWRVGERYYSRYNKPPAIERRWGVEEITEQCLQDLYQMGPIPVDFRFIAIYVCSRAKLVVLDSHTNDNSNHSRSLIQSGGVIIAAGLIELCGPHEISEVRPLNLEEAVDSNYFSDLSDRTKQRIKGIQNPVIFLAPNASQFDSIAWRLDGEAYHDLNGDKPWRLYAPEGGRIVAIEEWGIGMNEIMVRHQLEQLHRTTVTCADANYLQPPYQLPANPDMWDRIQGTGPHANRELSVSQNAIYPNFVPSTN